MAELKPVYLIHGDDHGAVAERRAGLRSLAERDEGGTVGVELLEGDAATPAGVAEALAAMTLAIGQRRSSWKGSSAGARPTSRSTSPRRLRRCLPQTTLAMCAREEARPEWVTSRQARPGHARGVVYQRPDVNGRRARTGAAAARPVTHSPAGRASRLADLNLGKL